jgi:hypothetical protein
MTKKKEERGLRDDVRITYEKIDNRVNKVYAADVHFWVPISGTQLGNHEMFGAVAGRIRKALDSMMKRTLGAESKDAGWIHGSAFGVFYRKRYDKPSLIPDDSALDHILFGLADKHQVLNDTMAVAIELGFKDYDDAKAIGRTASLANKLGMELAQDVLGKAKLAMRFDQRLAGLKAEFEEEIKVKIADVLDNNKEMLDSKSGLIERLAEGWNITDVLVCIAEDEARYHLFDHVEQEERIMSCGGFPFIREDIVEVEDIETAIRGDKPEEEQADD